MSNFVPLLIFGAGKMGGAMLNGCAESRAWPAGLTFR